MTDESVPNPNAGEIRVEEHTMFRKLFVGLATFLAASLWSVALAGTRPDAHDKRLAALRKAGRPTLEKLAEEATANYEAMLGRDVEKSKKAIDYFVKRGAIEVACLALKHPFPEVEDHALARLGASKDRAALPHLLRTFHARTQDVVGGNAVRASQKAFARKTLVAMGTILDTDFSKVDLDDRKQISEALNVVERALKKRTVIIIGDVSYPCRIIRHDEKTITVYLFEAETVTQIGWEKLAPAERMRLKALTKKPPPAKPSVATDSKSAENRLGNQHEVEVEKLVAFFKDTGTWRWKDKAKKARLLEKLRLAGLLRAPALAAVLAPHLDDGPYRNYMPKPMSMRRLEPVLDAMQRIGMPSVPHLLMILKTEGRREIGGWPQRRRKLAVLCLVLIYDQGGQGNELARKRLELEAAKPKGKEKKNLLEALKDPLLAKDATIPKRLMK